MFFAIRLDLCILKCQYLTHYRRFRQINQMTKKMRGCKRRWGPEMDELENVLLRDGNSTTSIQTDPQRRRVVIIYFILG